MKCPGQDRRFWKPGAIFEVNCPKCGSTVEFFKDDTTRTCKKCGHRFLNPSMNFGCAAYCAYAEQCIGNLPPELIAQKDDLLKDRVAIEMKRYFNRDFRQIGHAIRVARYAEQIGREEQGNPAVILTAAYLHDIGVKEAEHKHQEAFEYHGKEGVPIAREILTRLKAREALIEEACDIIGHHHDPREEASINFKVVYDADMIANLEERHKEDSIETKELKEIIKRSFLTKSGRNLAESVLFKNPRDEESHGD